MNDDTTHKGCREAANQLIERTRSYNQRKAMDLAIFNSYISVATAPGPAHTS